MYDPEQPNDAAQTLHLCTKIRRYRKELINKINDIKNTLEIMDDVEQQAMATLEAQLRVPE
jgi:hypothetical protein